MIPPRDGDPSSSQWLGTNEPSAMNTPSEPSTPEQKTPVQSDNDLLTKSEVAARLHKTPRCIELWMRRGYLPYIKIRRSVLFHWPDVLSAMKRFQSGPPL
jgi:hypothetical protein